MNRTRAINLLCVAGLWLASGLALAQQQAQNEPTTAAEQTPKTNSADGRPDSSANNTSDNNTPDNSANNDPDNNTAGKKTPAGTVFNPTEEISEDAPVPFPVDI